MLKSRGLLGVLLASVLAGIFIPLMVGVPGVLALPQTVCDDAACSPSRERPGFLSSTVSPGDRSDDPTGATLPDLPGALTDLSVTPTETTITAGTSALYTATATDDVTGTFDVTADTLFSIDEAGHNGTWSGNQYTASRAGTWTVRGVYETVTDTAVLHVMHADPVSLVISPNEQTVTAGANASYTAVAEDAYGNTWDATGETVFSTPAGAGGSWASATYTSEFAGDWTVTGTLGGVNDTTVLHVLPGDPVTLVIAPSETTVTAGGAVVYTATATDTFGNSWDATGETVFGIASGAGGSWVGSTYTSARAGNWTVTGDYDGLRGNALLHVVHAAAVALEITPAEETVVAGGSVEYTAMATDAYNNSWEVTGATVFSISPLAGGTWALATYTSETAGDWTVTGVYGTLDDTADLHVIHSAVVAITLTPAETTIAAGASVVYTVMAEDAQGNTWDVTGGSSITIEVGAGGSWAGSTYTSEVVGTWDVTASYSGFGDTALLHVIHGTAVAIDLQPEDWTVTAGETVVYTVTATDSEGNAWDVTGSVSLSAPPEAGGSWTGALYTSEFAGDWGVRAELGDLSDTAILHVIPGPIVQIYLSPEDYQTNTGGSVVYSVTAEDNQGNLWDVTSSASFSAPPAAGGYWDGNVYHSENAGDWIITADVGVFSDTASLKVVPYVAFVPEITRRSVMAPDLVVERIIALAGQIKVVIVNRGSVPVEDEFWVDVYVDPVPPPEAVNETWPYLCSEGGVWGVVSSALPIQVGQAMTLTTGDVYYQPDLSSIAWPLEPGTPVYTQVDTANAHTEYGAVLESHEILGTAYNNVGGPKYVSAGFSPGLAQSDSVLTAPRTLVTSVLPVRPGNDVSVDGILPGWYRLR